MAIEALISTGSPSSQSMATVAALSGIPEARRRRTELGGILLDQVDLADAVERIEGFVMSGRPHQIVTVNLDFLSIAGRNVEFRSTLNAADLAVADGMPLVWLSRLKGQELSERVAGVDLVSESCRLAARLGTSVFLLGAAPGVAETAGRRLESMYPGLRIAGVHSPPMGTLTAEQDEELVEMVRAAGPGLLFVALGAPRQDLWIRQHQPRMQVPVAMGVGCVFDLLAGSVRRAPTWMQNAGLEWAFRLSQEPQRLWRRYLLNDLPTLVRLACKQDGEAVEIAAAAP